MCDVFGWGKGGVKVRGEGVSGYSGRGFLW